MLTIPPVVKQEKGENDDDDDELMIVGVTPATMDPPLIKEVKKEVPSPPPSPNRGVGMKEVSEDGSSSQKTPEEAQEENVAARCQLQRNLRRPSRQTRKGRVLLQTELHRRNRSWQERLKTQIQRVKK